MSYRVLQWATGNVGRHAIRGIVAHPQTELVGAFVYSQDKAGRDCGEIAGIGALGVRATNDVADALDLDADCVVYAPLLPDTDEVCRILESGKNIVTPVGWFWPYSLGSETVARLEAACRAGNASLHGTGINPGGMSDRFPLMISSLARDIRRVAIDEYSDIRNYDAPDVIREVMLMGKPPEVVADSPMLELLGSGFRQSIAMVAAALGIDLEGYSTRHDLRWPPRRSKAASGASRRIRWPASVSRGRGSTKEIRSSPRASRG